MIFGHKTMTHLFLVNAVDCRKVWSEHCPYSIMYGPYRWFMAIFHTSMFAPSWTIHLNTYLKHFGNDTITLMLSALGDIRHPSKSGQCFKFVHV